MHEALNVLYGANLGCDTPSTMYELASHVHQLEHKLLEWQSQLPPTLALISYQDLSQLQTHGTTVTRFQVVLTMRYLNLRILVHRPLLQEYLSTLEGMDQDHQRRNAILCQIGSSSLATCVQSAVSIIEIVSIIICSDGTYRHLLGAWWFCLFYSTQALLSMVFTTLTQLASIQRRSRNILCLPRTRRGGEDGSVLIRSRPTRYTANVVVACSGVPSQAGQRQ